MAVIRRDATGRFYVPDETLRELGYEDETELVVEAHPDDGTIVMRPGPEDDDSWLYTEETRASVRRAKEDIAAGRMRHMTEAEIREYLKSHR